MTGSQGRRDPAVALPTPAGPPEDGIVPLAAAPPGPRRGALARAALLVGPATMLANALGYAFNVVVSRALGPDGYGALGALLGLVLIGAVPALALQAVVARRAAVAAPGDAAHVVARLVRASAGVGLATTAVLLLAAPAVTAYLRLDGPAPAAWLAASLAPLAVVSALQGGLQGRERFGALAALFVAAAALRLAGGVVAVATGGGAAEVLAGTTAGSLLAAGLGMLLVRRALGAAQRGGAGGAGLVRELGRAGLGLLALVTLANVDVLLARHHLPPVDAGRYAVGAVLAKAAFWAPQAVLVVAYPRLTRASARRALRVALACTAGCGAALTLATAALARPLLTLVFGAQYAPLAGTAWAFAALGALLAVAQLLVFDAIAGQRGRLALLVGGAAVGQVVVTTLWLHDSAGQVVGVALASVAVLVLAGALPGRRGRGQASGAGSQWTTLQRDSSSSSSGP